MGSNMLAGSGPRLPGAGGNVDGPPMTHQGANGVAPQAAPNRPSAPQAPNMLAGAGTPSGALPRAASAPPPIVPPPLPLLIEALHKTSYINSALKALLGKPDLKTRDVLNEVGEAVAEGVMGPFHAAKELATIPPTGDSLALRQWVGQHYATSAQHMNTIAEMIEAHGQMVRRGGQPRGTTPVNQGAMPPPGAGLQNALMSAGAMQ